MKLIHHCLGLTACLALAVVGQGCQSTPTTTEADEGAMPRDPRAPLNEMKEARFLAAIEGLDFETGLVVVTDPPARPDRELALKFHADGLEKLQANRRTGALADFTMAVRSDPGFAVGYNSLGRALRAKGKDEHALAAYRTAVTLDPELADALYNVATTLARLDRQPEAIEQMHAVLILDPGRAKAHERLAIWYYYAGDANTAWHHVDAARDLGHEPPGQFLALLEARTAGAQRPSALE